MTNSDPYAITIRNVFQGTYLPFKVNFWQTPPDPNAVPPVTGTPEDISSWAFMFTMKKALEDADTDAVYLYDWTIAAGAGTGGSTSWSVPADIINSIEAKHLYYWDLRGIVPPSTQPSELLAGTVFLNPSVGQRLTSGLPASPPTAGLLIDHISPANVSHTATGNTTILIYGDSSTAVYKQGTTQIVINNQSQVTTVTNNYSCQCKVNMSLLTPTPGQYPIYLTDSGNHGNTVYINVT
jgi:hypothetical protein